MHEYIFFYNTDYLLYISMQHIINSVKDYFIHKSWLSFCCYLKLNSLEIELPSQKNEFSGLNTYRKIDFWEGQPNLFLNYPLL